MLGAFNPYVAGSAPNSPNVSADAISRLLGGADAGVKALIGGIEKAGEINRSTKLNELLSTGGFQGLTEEQARQKLAQVTGGQSVNPIVQANVNDIISGQQAREVADAKSKSQLGLEQFKFQNELTKLEQEGTQKQALEEIKSKLGLESDLTLEQAKAKNDQVLRQLIFGQDKELAKFESDLKTSLVDQNKLPDRYMSMGSGLVLDRVTGEVKKSDVSKELTTDDILKSLSPEAEKQARNLTKIQQENLAKAIQSGKVGYKPFVEDKKSGTKSGGFFYDAENPTGIGITISTKKQ